MKKEELIALSRNMVEYRARNNISQGKLAELCKLSHQTICNVENQVQSPTKLTAQKILNIIKN